MQIIKWLDLIRSQNQSSPAQWPGCCRVSLLGVGSGRSNGVLRDVRIDVLADGLLVAEWYFFERLKAFGDSPAGGWRCVFSFPEADDLVGRE